MIHYFKSSRDPGSHEVHKFCQLGRALSECLPGFKRKEITSFQTYEENNYKSYCVLKIICEFIGGNKQQGQQERVLEIPKKQEEDKGKCRPTAEWGRKTGNK